MQIATKITIPKNALKLSNLLWIVILIISFKFFQSTKLELIFNQIGSLYLFSIAFISISLFFIYVVIYKKIETNKVVLYYIIIMMLVPIYSSILSNRYFGQPYLYGLLAERSWLSICTAFLFFYLVKNKSQFIVSLESIFLIIAWSSLIFYTIYAISFDPETLIDGARSGVARLTQGRGLRFKFNIYFIGFGTIYYYIKYFKYKLNRYLIFFILFFGYLLFIHQGRVFLLITIMTLFVYTIRNVSFTRFIMTCLLC